MVGKPAARLGDMTTHGTPLSLGLGSMDVFIGGKPALHGGQFKICIVVPCSMV